ncbi:MAG: glycosyltransferase family 2 protein [Saprospiraceae bacterium]|nr:glycosyltransferase family 2 protein [Saprospiraceae bacterium]
MISIFKPGSNPETPIRNEVPSIALIVCAYNEEDYIIDKLENSLNLLYPQARLSIYFVIDGSDDNTYELLDGYDIPDEYNVKVLHDPVRAGKVGAMNRVMEIIEEDIAVFTDANSMLNPEAIMHLIKHFQDKDVALVAGEKSISKDGKMNVARGGEGLYWKYESHLKYLESRVGNTIGAAGEIFAIRSDLYDEIPGDSIIEDFYLSMKMALKGKKIGYEPLAIASETGSLNIAEERKRKIRIANGAFQVIGRLKGLFRFWNTPMLTWQYFSHKILRWAAVPFLLPILLVLNGILAYFHGGIYLYLMIIQMIFYTLAFIGYLFNRKKSRSSVLFIPFYIVFMNTSIIEGFFQFLFSKGSVNWEKARRG